MTPVFSDVTIEKSRTSSKSSYSSDFFYKSAGCPSHRVVCDGWEAEAHRAETMAAFQGLLLGLEQEPEGAVELLANEALSLHA